MVEKIDINLLNNEINNEINNMIKSTEIEHMKYLRGEYSKLAIEWDKSKCSFVDPVQDNYRGATLCIDEIKS